MQYISSYVHPLLRVRGLNRSRQIGEKNKKGQATIYLARASQYNREENCIARWKGGQMLIKCCNPKCEAPFDYREGRLIRFSGNRATGKPAENHPLIRHFWLCGKCSERYVFAYERGAGMKIRPRVAGSQETAARTSAATA